MEAVPSATPGNFMDHLAMADGPPSDNAVPDNPVQVQDAPPEKRVPLDPGPPTNEEGEPDPDAPVDPDAPTEDPAPPDEAAELETLRKLKAELDEGYSLPESLAQKTWPVKINGQVYDVPIAELGQGYQRNADYSRKLAEVQQMREQATNVQAGAQRLIADLSGNPEAFLQAAKELGFYKTFLEAARAEGKKRLALRELPVEAQQYAMQLEEERMEREVLARKTARLEQEMQAQRAQEPNQDQIRIRHQLEQMVPRAFAKHKLGDYPLARDLFTSNLRNLYEGGELQPGTVDAAAQATAEQLADIAQRLPKTRPANTNGGLPARRAAPAAGAPVARRASGTSSDFAEHLERLSGGR